MQEVTPSAGQWNKEPFAALMQVGCLGWEVKSRSLKGLAGMLNWLVGELVKKENNSTV